MGYKLKIIIPYFELHINTYTNLNSSIAVSIIWADILEKALFMYFGMSLYVKIPMRRIYNCPGPIYIENESPVYKIYHSQHSGCQSDRF